MGLAGKCLKECYLILVGMSNAARANALNATPGAPFPEGVGPILLISYCITRVVNDTVLTYTLRLRMDVLEGDAFVHPPGVIVLVEYTITHQHTSQPQPPG